MVMGSSVAVATLTGDKELDRQLSRLRMSVQNKLMRQAVLVALRHAAKGMKSEIQTNSAKNTSRVKKTIGHRFRRNNKKSGRTEVLVGASVGKKYGKMPHGVFFLSTSGQERFRHSGGSTGRFPAMRSHGAIMRGWHKSEAQAFANLKTSLRAGIEREARKK